MNFWKITELIIVQVLLSLLLFAIAITLLVFLVRKPMRQYKPVDMAIFDRFKPSVNSFNNKVMLFITFLGKHQFLIPANLLLILYFSLVTKQNWFSVRVLAIALSSLFLMLALKNLFQRKRPLSPLLKAAKGLSFPSGHAIMAVTFYGLLIYIIDNTVEIDWLRSLLIVLLVILIIWIALSRVYLRVHYASDILAGLIIGLIWLFISLGVINKVEDFVRNQQDSKMSENRASFNRMKPIEFMMKVDYIPYNYK